MVERHASIAGTTKALNLTTLWPAVVTGEIRKYELREVPKNTGSKYLVWSRSITSRAFV